MLQDPCHGARHHVRGDSGSSRQRLVFRAGVWILPYGGLTGPRLPAAGPPAHAPLQPPVQQRRLPGAPPGPSSWSSRHTACTSPLQLHPLGPAAAPSRATAAAATAAAPRPRCVRLRRGPESPGPPAPAWPRGHAPQTAIGAGLNVSPPPFYGAKFYPRYSPDSLSFLTQVPPLPL